ncbi:MAG TPA: hypothetical protein H9832_01420 [Candidatus Agathobaculum merdavium]|nr:hypothetical protein [Candidatus Agathobaculum merdavium]
MAKYEKHLVGDFDAFLEYLFDGIMNGSVSASYEDGSEWTANGVRVAVRVFERFSYMGGNRVSLNITLAGSGNNLFLTAITAGGSQAMFWKLNTIGEENFLDKVIELAESYAEG